MIENRKKINFKTKIKVSSFRFLGGLFVSLLLSFSIYLFFIYCRDYTRLLTFTNNHNYLELSKKELFFYDFFFAFLSLTIGQSYFLKIAFHKNKNLNEKQTGLRRKIVHDQNVLIWFFMFWFIRTAGLTAFLYMNFNTEYPIDFYYDLNFYNEYWYLFVLILCVLFLQSWQALGLSLKRHYIKMFLTILMLILTSIVFTQIKFTDFESYFKNEHLNNIYLKERIELPKIDNYEYFDNYNIKGQIFINKKFELIYKQKKVNVETLIKNLINLENTPYYDYSISMLRLNIDKNLPIDSLYKLKSKIYFNTGFEIFYATYPKSTKYDENYFQDNHFGIKDSLVLNLQQIASNNLFISKFSNIISLKQNDYNQIAFNSIILDYDEIVEKIKASILLDNNYIIKIELKENATFSDYISILSLAKKGYSKANIQILKESKKNGENYNYQKRNLDFRLLDVNQPHPTKELFKLTEIPKNTNGN